MHRRYLVVTPARTMTIVKIFILLKSLRHTYRKYRQISLYNIIADNKHKKSASCLNLTHLC